MNIPPIMERLLLSNEAVFKNASLGLSGQNFIYVPPGKSAVILEINIQPFINQIEGNVLSLLNAGLDDVNQQEIYDLILQKMMFQLQIVNDTYNTYFSFQNKFGLDWQAQVGPTSKDHVKMNLKFEGWKDDVFIYIDRSLYFNFIYPSVEIEGATVPGWTPVISTPAASFTAQVQDLPKKSVTFKGNTAIEFPVVYTLNGGLAGNLYSPTGRNITNGENAALRENFTLAQDNGPLYPDNPQNSIMSPVLSGLSYTNFSDILTMPFLNVKYALINKRPEDYGLTQPKF